MPTSVPAPARHGAAGWLALAAAAALLVAAPLAAIVAIAAEGSGELWPHLARHVLPRAVRDTVVLLLGVGVLTAAIGAGTAWLAAAFDFPGRRVLDWALLLPLAVPTYIQAYAWLDIVHPLGPVQRMLDALAGPRAVALPDVRSMGGCIAVLGLVLYPYVYLPARAAFLMQAAGPIEAARTLGATPARVFRTVALPLARPAIAVGVALALLEALNDVGAAEFLGVQTLTVSIYSTWINRSSLPGAAQIAVAMLAVIVGLLALERAARRARPAAAAREGRRMAPVRLRGARAWLATAACALPVLLGFAAPGAHLAAAAVERVGFAGLPADLPRDAATTLALSAAATAVTLALGFAAAATARVLPSRASRLLARAAALGYAVPGTVLATGLLVPLAAADNAIDATARALLGVSTGLVLSGSGAALVWAYAARFGTIAIGSAEAGFARVPASLDHAARTLGMGPGGVARRVLAPLARPALAAAALLVFVDCMKELPATLLLRPLNVETLATRLYADASRGSYEDGAVAALLIVLAGLAPVILLARAGKASR